ncbi:hypothetical protein M9H77_03926 [Catharanthus roseus]|uniref:Uncharacterized protein n=1 Tax=Catharanthus roseus TaxID=4058 RepID=A0ACC0CD13_CATRO|nr:hypothetical protein M9H77_03926 [Catharanthus roseus]
MQHASHVEVWHQWRQHIKDDLLLPVEDLSSPRDDYIKWYRDIMRVYIGNPANRNTRTIGYQTCGVDRRMMTSMLQEVDDMATGVIQGPPSSPKQIASFAKKIQTIIRRCMVCIGGTLGCTPSQHDIQQTFPVQPSRHRPREPVLDCGARGVKRGAHRLPGGGARSCPSSSRWTGTCRPRSPDIDIPTFSLGLTPPAQSHPSGLGTSYAPPPPDYTVSSESNDDDDTDTEEEDIQTPINLIIENTVTQWQSSQRFSSERYDYTESGAFLDMGLDEQIDDLIKSGTLRLLDWNDSRTDIQLGMRLTDKDQAISAVQNRSIRMAENIELAWYAQKFAIERVFDSRESTFNYSTKISTSNARFKPRDCPRVLAS